MRRMPGFLQSRASGEVAQNGHGVYFDAKGRGAELVDEGRKGLGVVDLYFDNCINRPGDRPIATNLWQATQIRQGWRAGPHTKARHQQRAMRPC